MAANRRGGLVVEQEKKSKRIEVRLRDLGQLFNTMDPSPFHDKDLDQDAEEYIESWAQEFPVKERVMLVIHLAEWPAGQDPQALAEQAIHNYFSYKARINKWELRRLLLEGWWSLLIGIAFLFLCLIAGKSIGEAEKGTFLSLLRESLVIGGWVAMWRPLEICLYAWWPIFRRGLIREKLSRMPVKVIHGSAQ
jgi:hypothetical protein